MLAPAWAGLFSVTPVRIFMTPRERAAAVTVTNEGDTELLMQADVYDWKQKADGSDDLTLSEDMILAPPIIKLAPKSRQVVRLALLKPVTAGQQAAEFRLEHDNQGDRRVGRQRGQNRAQQFQMRYNGDPIYDSNNA